MKWIDFENPTSVDDAVKLLSSSNGEAKLLAGGTDLIVQMRAGALAPSLVEMLSPFLNLMNCH